jgi:sulfatase modifying factor 1
MTPAPASKIQTRGMVRLNGGPFLMGADDEIGYPQDGEGPVREVTLSPFWIDSTAVTNKQFNRFVKETGYRTEAEERFGWSFVFQGLLDERELKRVKQRLPGAEWWCRVGGACWRKPEGPRSNINVRMDHPVVHVSWNDAQACCKWLGKRLPTEAEHEFAARGGLVQKRYAWGDDLTPGGRHMCNIWQGVFPDHNTQEDGYPGTAPTRSFPPNGYGLFNMTGNTWEWCWGGWSTDDNLEGPIIDPTGPTNGSNRINRGGSFLCHESYCNRYRVAARTKNTPDSAASNLGFRCVAADQ